MCGIFGVFGIQSIGKSLYSKNLNNLRHRGPDNCETWVNEGEDLILGHTRLSIIDLSEAGNQPMTSANGRFTISYNGEIYNFHDLKNEIEDQKGQLDLKSGNDTEILLEYISIFGLQKALLNIVGMFSFILFDKYKDELILVRDRLGEKPLFFSLQGAGSAKTLSVASEMKGLTNYINSSVTFDEHSLYNSFRFGFFHSNTTPFKEIFKVNPGTFVVASRNYKTKSIDIVTNTYWDFSSEIKNRSLLRKQSHSNLSDVSKDFKRKLTKVIENQLISDAPLGAFLSGGIDSSVVTAMSCEVLGKPIETFTVAMPDDQYNEAPRAEKIANHLNTNHNEIVFHEDDALCLIDKLPEIFDEPFFDSSALPSLFLSKFAKKKVDVCLTGDGGDELFGGYNRHQLLTGRTGIIVSKLFRAAPQSTTIALLSHTMRGLNYLGLLKQARVKEKIKKFEKLFSQSNSKSIYGGLLEIDCFNYLLMDGLDGEFFQIDEILSDSNYSGLLPAEKMMALDTLQYLPNDILTKVDRSSMHYSLETRAPFLDHTLIEYAWGINANTRISKTHSKPILRSIAADYIPSRILDAPKMGFAAPMAKWLSGPLQGMLLEVVNRDNVESLTELSWNKVEDVLTAHIQNKQDNSEILWRILVFIKWASQQKVCVKR
jgi:asparagine synthase (glutamine-hydrolysing)